MLAFAGSEARSLELKSPVPVEIGGRFLYDVRVSRQGVRFPWNYTSSAVSDRTRLMLDLRMGNADFGELYLKGAALQRTDLGPRGERRFDFEQGDYFWQDKGERTRIGVRLFANERRFFTHALIAPIVEDDRVKGSGKNRGARVDGDFFKRLSITGLYSTLGDDFDDGSRIAYLRTAFAHDHFAISTAYLHEDRPVSGLPDLAVFKTELTGYYKRASLLLSYEQSGFGRGFFFPKDRFHFDRFVGDNFSTVLPNAGAFFAEARLVALPVRKLGIVNLIHRYFAVREAFNSGLVGNESGSVGYTTGAYFTADSISVNGRMVYTKRVRSAFETESEEKVEASIWAALENGSEVFIRGGIGRTSDAFPFEIEENFIHTALKYRLKKLQSGVHFMLKDIDTIFSEQRVAWESRVAFRGNIAISWRTIFTKNFTTNDAVHARLEYRPSSHLFFAVSYGRAFIGDDPFLLEDPDISIIGTDTPIYGFCVRGDF